MPEMPEVETTKCGITPYILKQTITNVIVRQWQLRWPIPKQLPRKIKNQQILGITRRAKYLLFNFSTGTMIIHLGMSGHLRIITKNAAPNKHDHIDFLFRNQQCLRFTDPRRFGAVLWSDGNPENHPLLVKLGPEPLTHGFNSRYLANSCQQRKQAIKNVIMDHTVVVGVGNIYACESLFKAKINPNKSANALTLSECQQLTKAIKATLRKAINAGGTTLKDFVQADGRPGYFRHQLQVYGRLNDNCYDCHTLIVSKRIGQRNTFFCPTCQPPNALVLTT